MEKIVYFFFLGAICLSICGIVTMANGNNDNATVKEDTYNPIVETPKPASTPIQPAVKPTPPPTPVATPTPVQTQASPIEGKTFEERKQEQQIEQLTKNEPKTEDTPAEEQYIPVDVTGVIDPDGYVYVGQEFAGRNVKVQEIV